MRMLSVLIFASLLGCTSSKAPEAAPPAAKETAAAKAKPATKPADHAGHGHAKGEACNCAKGKDGGTIWCEKCAKGFIGGKATKCKSCWQGKTSDKAVWCDHCKTGYISGNRITCKICFDHINTGGPACKEHPGGPTKHPAVTGKDDHGHDHGERGDHKH